MPSRTDTSHSYLAVSNGSSVNKGKSVFQDEFMDIGVMYFTNMMDLRSNKTSAVDRDWLRKGQTPGKVAFLND